MGVSNGQDAVEATFNSSFMDREIDTSTVGQVALLNADAESGPDVLNTQKEINGLNTFTGRLADSGFDQTPAWASTDAGTPADDLKMRAEALSEKFDGSTGHTHSGAAGQGSVIPASNLGSVRLRGYVVRGTDLLAVTGTSKNVSTPLTGKTASTGDTVKGIVVVSANRVILRDASAPTEEDQLRSLLGDVIFGRLTEAAGVWTLSFFTNIAGTETAYNFTVAQDIAWFYQELFNPITDAPIYDQLFNIGSDNATQDVIDATATLRGLMSAAAQTFGGDKTFNDDVVFDDSIATHRLDVASAASIAQLSSLKTFVKLTGTTATTIHGILAGVDGQILTFHNGTNTTALIKHQSSTAVAADRLKLASGFDLSIPPDSSAEFIYDTNQSRWVTKSGSGGGASGGALQITSGRATPYNVVSGTGIPFTATDARSLWFIQGSGGHTGVGATPQISAGVTVGQELILVGRNADQTVVFHHGDGLSINGEITLGLDHSIGFFWDGTNWVELFRRVA